MALFCASSPSSISEVCSGLANMPVLDRRAIRHCKSEEQVDDTNPKKIFVVL